MNKRRRTYTLALTYGLAVLTAYQTFQILQNEAISSKQGVADDRWIGSNEPKENPERPSQTMYSTADGIDVGLLSGKHPNFIRQLQQAIDGDDPSERCRRYGFTYNSSHPRQQHRRIFYGAIMANEPWEVFELVAAECHGLLTGMVLVEANRTQNYSPRIPLRLHHQTTFQTLFGLDNILIQKRVNENKTIKFLEREHAQRADILSGWKTLGMQADDVGFLADVDETFSRDFLRAVQTCNDIHSLDYKTTNCRPLESGIAAYSQIFEMSPECITTDQRFWKHPDLITGHCIEGIGNVSNNPHAERQTERFKSHLRVDQGEVVEQQQRYPLFSAADFRTIGGRTVEVEEATRSSGGFERFTGYHFHNFVTDMGLLRHKYRTYAHPDRAAMHRPLEDIHEDLALVIECVKNMSHHPKALYERVVGGFDALKPRFRPIYFEDTEYRRRRHELVTRLLNQDEHDVLAMKKDAIDEPADDDSAAELNARLTELFGPQKEEEDNDDDDEALAGE